MRLKHNWTLDTDGLPDVESIGEIIESMAKEIAEMEQEEQQKNEQRRDRIFNTLRMLREGLMNLDEVMCMKAQAPEGVLRTVVAPELIQMTIQGTLTILGSTELDLRELLRLGLVELNQAKRDHEMVAESLVQAEARHLEREKALQEEHKIQVWEVARFALYNQRLIAMIENEQKRPKANRRLLGALRKQLDREVANENKIAKRLPDTPEAVAEMMRVFADAQANPHPRPVTEDPPETPE